MNEQSVDHHSPIIEITAANLHAEALEASRNMPVLLNIWAEADPDSSALMPMLSRLAREYGGKFRLANMDAAHPDNRQVAQQLAMQLGAQRLPVLTMLFGDNAPKTLPGVPTEEQLRQLLDEVTMSPADRILAQIDAMVAAGEAERALQMVQQILQEEPGNAALQVMQANLLLQLGRIEDARQVVAALPGDAPGADQPRAKLQLLSMAADIAPRDQVEAQLRDDAGNLEALYQLSVHQVLADQEEEAYESLLKIIAKDRAFRDDGARQLMLHMFEQKGASDPLVRRYRNRLFSLLH